MIGLGEIRRVAPVDAGGEVVLEGPSPAPDGGLIVGVGLPIVGHDGVVAVGPDGPRLAFGLVEPVASAPTAVTGRDVAGQSILDQVEKRRGVALHDVCQPGIPRRQRPVAVDDVLFQPRIIDQVEEVIGPVVVMLVAGNTAPGGLGVLPPALAVGVRGRDDVEQLRKSAWTSRLVRTCP